MSASTQPSVKRRHHCKPQTKPHSMHCRMGHSAGLPVQKLCASHGLLDVAAHGRLGQTHKYYSFLQPCEHCTGQCSNVMASTSNMAQPLMRTHLHFRQDGVAEGKCNGTCSVTPQRMYEIALITVRLLQNTSNCIQPGVLSNQAGRLTQGKHDVKGLRPCAFINCVGDCGSVLRLACHVIIMVSFIAIRWHCCVPGVCRFHGFHAILHKPQLE